MQICLVPLEFKTKGCLPIRGARVGISISQGWETEHVEVDELGS